MSHSKCYNCGHPVAPTALFCKDCGVALEGAANIDPRYKALQKVRKCPHCKREFTAGVSTCPHCKVATRRIEGPDIGGIDHNISMSTKEPGDPGCNVCPECKADEESYCHICGTCGDCLDRDRARMQKELDERLFLVSLEGGNIKMDGETYIKEVKEGTFSENRYPIERFESGNIRVDDIEYAPVELPYVTKDITENATKSYQPTRRESPHGPCNTGGLTGYNGED